MNKQLIKLLQKKASGLTHFNKWEKTLKNNQAPEDILAGLGAIFEMLPPEVRLRNTDPEYVGLQKMRSILALLDKNR